MIKEYNMRKRLLAICAAALMLSGCSKTPVYSDIGEFPDLSSVSSKSSSSTKRSEPIYPEESSVPEEEPLKIPVRDLRNITVSLTNDFTNERTLTIKGETITVEVKNGDWVTESVRIGSAVFLKEEDGNITRFTFDGTYLRKGYLNLELWSEDGQIITYRIMHDKEGYAFPDVMEIYAINERALESPKALTHEQTLRYITKDGTAEHEKEVLDEIQKLSDKICRGLRTDYQKLRAISRWVSDNIYYDYAAYKAGIPDECLTLEYMLEKRASVCGGYAAMTSALCEAQGIATLHINGLAINQGNCYAEADNGLHHEWNYALVGSGAWVDSGWNSGAYLYVTGEYSHSPINYKYFDIGGEVFALNHKCISAELRDYFPDN